MYLSKTFSKTLIRFCDLHALTRLKWNIQSYIRRCSDGTSSPLIILVSRVANLWWAEARLPSHSSSPKAMDAFNAVHSSKIRKLESSVRSSRDIPLTRKPRYSGASTKPSLVNRLSVSRNVDTLAAYRILRVSSLSFVPGFNVPDIISFLILVWIEDPTVCDVFVISCTLVSPII